MFDEIVIVEQPCFCRHDPLSGGRCRCHHPVGLDEDALVLGQTGEQPVLSGAPVHAVEARQGDGVVLELVAAQQFRAQQSLIRDVAQKIWLSSGGPRSSEDYGRAPLLKRQGTLLDSVRLRGTSASQRIAWSLARAQPMQTTAGGL